MMTGQGFWECQELVRINTEHMAIGNDNLLRVWSLKREFMLGDFSIHVFFHDQTFIRFIVVYYTVILFCYHKVNYDYGIYKG